MRVVEDQLIEGKHTNSAQGIDATDAIHRRLNSSSDFCGVESLAKSAELLMSSPKETMKNKKSDGKKLKNAECENTDEGNGTTKFLAIKKNVKKSTKNTSKKKSKAHQKKRMSNDEDFEIDPRLGGSKIKQSIKSTKKDKMRKSTDQDFKKVKSSIEQRSPYVHVEGNWDHPTVVKLINVPGHIKDDETEGKGKVSKAAQYIDEEHRNKASKVGFASTLSNLYDSQNRDASWICVFCKNYTHSSCLGDLFGPYYINQVNPSESFKNVELERIGNLEDQSFASTAPHKKDQTIDEKTEVWFHESCLYWTPGVCLVPPRLIGLEEAVADSRQLVCEYCKKSSANIFCRTRGCGLVTHFPCASLHGWSLVEETLIAFCPVHSNQVKVS